MEGLDRAAAARQEAQESRRVVRATVAAARALRSTLRSERAQQPDLAALARLLHAEHTMAGTAERVVELALQAVPGCTHASVTLPGPVTPAATDALARRLDNLQYALGSGPCLQAMTTAAPVLAPDLTDEERWPEFAAVAVRSGVSSVLACRMTLAGEVLGTLNLYAEQAGTFHPGLIPVATAYAAHAAAALSRVAEHEQVVQLRQAVSSDRMIGTAIGLLMWSRGISEAEAFDLLRAVSQHTNRKLRDIAAEVVAQGGVLS